MHGETVKYTENMLCIKLVFLYMIYRDGRSTKHGIRDYCICWWTIAVNNVHGNFQNSVCTQLAGDKNRPTTGDQIRKLGWLQMWRERRAFSSGWNVNEKELSFDGGRSASRVCLWYCTVILIVISWTELQLTVSCVCVCVCSTVLWYWQWSAGPSCSW
jgi:hypothetical protein